MYISQRLSIGGELIVTDATTLHNSLSVGTSAFVNGDIITSYNLSVQRDVIIRDELSVGNSSYFGGSLNAANAVAMSSTLSVSGPTKCGALEAGDVNIDSLRVNQATKSEVYSVVVNGSVQAASFVSYSDARIKRVRREQMGSIDKLNRLKVLLFEYKGDLGHGRETTGLLANNVADVYPNCVNEGDAHIKADREPPLVRKGPRELWFDKTLRCEVRVGDSLVVRPSGESGEKKESMHLEVVGVRGDSIEVDAELRHEEYEITGYDMREFMSVDYNQLLCELISCVKAQQLELRWLEDRLDAIESGVF
jgi:hypothetical protein